MAEIGESTLHMLNPYKFATWQFMRQYFSVSPQMYFQYPDVNLTKFSYNELFYRTILPFEAKFNRTTGNINTNVTIGGYTYNQEWAYNNIPFQSCLPRDFKNLRNPNDTNFDKKILSGNIQELNSTAWNHGPVPHYYQSHEQTPTDYFLPYHGSIFAAVIPVFTLNKVLKHKEMVTASYYDGVTTRNVDIVPPNFFSTYTRTSYPQYYGEFSNTNLDDQLANMQGVPITPTPTRFNEVFAATGLYSRYFGERRTVVNGNTLHDDTLPYSQDASLSSSCFNNFNFAGKGYGSYNTSAFRVLNKIANNIDTPNFNNINIIESDMIYGMAHHTNTYIRVTN